MLVLGSLSICSFPCFVPHSMHFYFSFLFFVWRLSGTFPQRWKERKLIVVCTELIKQASFVQLLVLVVVPLPQLQIITYSEKNKGRRIQQDTFCHEFPIILFCLLI